MPRIRRCFVALSFAFGSFLGVYACSSDDIIYAPTRDAGPDATLDAGDAEPPPPDAADAGDGQAPQDAGDAGDAGEPASWLLFTFNGSSGSDLVAYNLVSRAVDGTPLSYPGFIGTTYVDRAPSGAILWNLEQQNDVVRRLDPTAPWQGGPAWNVRLDDRPDGGDDYANPVTVVSGPEGKAYVLRFNRNALAVINPTEQGDASVPIKTIDLSRFVETIDSDRRVDMAGAVYVPERKRLYVVLGNIDLMKTDPARFLLLCTAARPRIVAIDTDTDTVIVPSLDAGAGDAGPDAGDAGPDAGDAGDGGTGSGDFTFGGYNPVFNGLVYDAPRERFLVLSGGCNEPSTDAGAGPVRRRQIDAIDPNTGRAEMLLDLSDKAYPLSRVQTDATHWAIGFGSEAFLWDVTTRTLGEPIPNAPQSFVFDGQQSLIGTTTADGGSIIVSTPLSGGAPTTLGPIPPFTSPGQFAGALDFWSR